MFRARVAPPPPPSHPSPWETGRHCRDGASPLYCDTYREPIGRDLSAEALPTVRTLSGSCPRDLCGKQASAPPPPPPPPRRSSQRSSAPERHVSEEGSHRTEQAVACQSQKRMEHNVSQRLSECNVSERYQQRPMPEGQVTLHKQMDELLVADGFGHRLVSKDSDLNVCTSRDNKASSVARLDHLDKQASELDFRYACADRRPSASWRDNASTDDRARADGRVDCRDDYPAQTDRGLSNSQLGGTTCDDRHSNSERATSDRQLRRQASAEPANYGSSSSFQERLLVARQASFPVPVAESADDIPLLPQALAPFAQRLRSPSPARNACTLREYHTGSVLAASMGSRAVDSSGLADEHAPLALQTSSEMLALSSQGRRERLTRPEPALASPIIPRGRSDDCIDGGARPRSSSSSRRSVSQTRDVYATIVEATAQVPTTMAECVNATMDRRLHNHAASIPASADLPVKVRVRIGLLEFRSAGSGATGLFDEIGFRVVLSFGGERPAVAATHCRGPSAAIMARAPRPRWQDTLPATKALPLKFGRAVSKDGLYSAVISCDFDDSIDLVWSPPSATNPTDRLSADVWMEKRTAVERIDSVLSMIGLGGGLPEYERTLLGRAVASLPPVGVDGLPYPWPVESDGLPDDRPMPKTLSLGLEWLGPSVSELC